MGTKMSMMSTLTGTVMYSDVYSESSEYSEYSDEHRYRERLSGSM
jgi:hypothetical protein